MSEEVGEVCHHVLKGIPGIRSGINGINKKVVADGVADALIYGLQLLSKLGIDAEHEISLTIHNVLARDWKEDPSGSGTTKPIQGEDNVEPISTGRILIENSSNVVSCGWDFGVLAVEFKGGAIYHYFNVPSTVFNELMKADSFGQYLNKEIKPLFKFEKQ